MDTCFSPSFYALRLGHKARTKLSPSLTVQTAQLIRVYLSKDDLEDGPTYCSKFKKFLLWLKIQFLHPLAIREKIFLPREEKYVRTFAVRILP